MSKCKRRTILVGREKENNVLVRQGKLFQARVKCFCTSGTSGKHMDRKQPSLGELGGTGMRGKETLH